MLVNRFDYGYGCMEENSDGEYVKYSEAEIYLNMASKILTSKPTSITELDRYRQTVYEYYFYNDKKWTFEGQCVFFNGHSIHYSDFMKAKRGSL